MVPNTAQLAVPIVVAGTQPGADQAVTERVSVTLAINQLEATCDVSIAMDAAGIHDGGF
jgi:hypothetical protein